MGLTKDYLRYVADGTIGVIATTKAGVKFVEINNIKDRYVAVSAVENVIIWDLKTSAKVLTLSAEGQEITCLAPTLESIAVGYIDGSIAIFSLTTGDKTGYFPGHKSEVTSLAFDTSNLILCSGSKDTHLIIWDLVANNGLYKLKGHKGVITNCQFMKTIDNILISSSKDTLIKFWDLDNQHCFQTIIGHKSEVWNFALVYDESILISGSTDSLLRFWSLDFSLLKSDGDEAAKKSKLDTTSEDGSLVPSYMGAVNRVGKDKVSSLIVDESHSFLICHGPASTPEIFRLFDLKHRRKRTKKRLLKNVDNSADKQIAVEDYCCRFGFIKSRRKIKSSDVIRSASGDIEFVGVLQSNEILTWKFGLESQPEPRAGISLPGHRTDVRTVGFTSDASAIVTASAESVKVWNTQSLQCIRTVDTGEYCTSILVHMKDRYAIVGTKSGTLLIVNLINGNVDENMVGHEGPIWSLSPTPDGRSFASGSADKQVKLWDFELNLEKQSLLASHSRTLELMEEVLCVKISPNGKYLAVSCLDATVKVYFLDTFKFFLNMYGHKLPVISIDISHDSKLLVSGSADKNIKIWGMDFGDCHRSIFAHDDSIMAVKFLPNSKMMVSAGKDGKIKQWDADSFEMITAIVGHHSEILAMAVCGKYIVTSSHDKTTRLWYESDEILVISEEREIEREKEENEALAKRELIIPGEIHGEVDTSFKQTNDSFLASNRIIEALVFYEEQSQSYEKYLEIKKSGLQKSLPVIHPMLAAQGNISPSRHVLETLVKIRSSDLEPSLLLLPFDKVLSLLPILSECIQNSINIELCLRCQLFLMRVHYAHISTNQNVLLTLDKVRDTAIKSASQVVDMYGFNLEGLRYLARRIEEKEEINFFAEVYSEHKQKDKRRKKRQKAIISLKT